MEKDSFPRPMCTEATQTKKGEEQKHKDRLPLWHWHAETAKAVGRQKYCEVLSSTAAHTQRTRQTQPTTSRKM